MTCRYDRDAEDYLIDGKPCRTDEYGDPTRHCTARRTCSEHVGWGELTCARCIGRTRADIRAIRDLAPLMFPVALGAGVDSEAANLAGPAADVRDWEARRIAMRAHLVTWEALGRITEKQHLHARATMEDDDERHPYTVLTRWQMMLAEDYGHPLPDRMTTSDAAAYLERTLPRLAHDEEQDFPLFRDEIRKCRSHLEGVLRNSRNPERGAPCPDCADDGKVIRMTRSFGHWCESEDCERMHYSVMVIQGELVPDTTGDWWKCPRGHARSHEDYSRWIEERGARRGAIA